MTVKYQARLYKTADAEDVEDWSDYFDSLRACVDSAQEVCDASGWQRFVVEKIEDVATYNLASKWVKA